MATAVSLNLMCSALAIEVFTLVFGFFTFIVKTQSSNLTLRIVQAVGHTLMSMWVHSYLLTLLLLETQFSFISLELILVLQLQEFFIIPLTQKVTKKGHLIQAICFL